MIRHFIGIKFTNFPESHFINGIHYVMEFCVDVPPNQKKMFSHISKDNNPLPDLGTYWHSINHKDCMIHQFNINTDKVDFYLKKWRKELLNTKYITHVGEPIQFTDKQQYETNILSTTQSLRLTLKKDLIREKMHSLFPKS